MSPLRSALLAAALLARGAAAAPALEVVEAVQPGWPAGQPREQRGHVDIEFTLIGREQSELRSAGSDLPAPFVAEALASFEAWLVRQPAGAGCGPVRGRARFEFDGASADGSAIAGVEVLSRPVAMDLPMLDRVEVNAGRVRRSARAGADALVKDPRGRAVAERRRQERWTAFPPPTEPAADAAAPPSVKIWVEPAYPREALERGADGDVVLALEVDAMGRVVDTEVTGATEPDLFKAATMAAVRRWQLRPARDAAGKPVPSRACQVVSFRLWSAG